MLVNIQLLLLYTRVLRDFAYEYTASAAIHWVLSDLACEYTVIVAIHMGFKLVCLSIHSYCYYTRGF